MRTGYGESIITPPIGTYLAGYSARTKPSIGVHDNLFVRSLFFETSEKNFVLMSLDLLGVDVELVDKITKTISSKLPVRKEDILIAAIHTHAGPDIFGVYSECDISFLRKYIVNASYGATLYAYNNMLDVKTAYTIGEVNGVTVNRRDPYKGKVDPRVYVFGFLNNNKPYILLSNFTSHAVVLGSNNLYISADYPGAFNNFIKILTGSNSIFFNGTCGDINPYTPGTNLKRVYDRNIGTFEDVEWMGKILSCEAVKQFLLNKKVSEEEALLITREIKVEIKKPYTINEAKEKLTKAEEKYKEALKAGKNIINAKLEVLKTKIIFTYLNKYWNGIRTRIGAVRLSKDSAILFLPSELLVKIGLSIKRESPFSNTAVVGYTNGYFGYIPTIDEYEKGGYETKYPTSIVKEGTAEILIKDGIKLLNELKTS